MRPISVARFERKLRAVTGVRGSAVLNDLDQLQGLIVLEQDRPEWALGGTEFLCASQLGQVAVVGQFSQIALLNPADSGLIIVVERLSSSVVPCLVKIEFPPFGVAGVQSDGAFRDSRAYVTQAERPAAHLFSFANAANQGNFDLYRLHAVASEHHAFVLAEGHRLVVSHVTVNVALNVAFAWREIPLEGGRLG